MTWCAGRFGWLPSQTRGEPLWDLYRLADHYVPPDQVKTVKEG